MLPWQRLPAWTPVLVPLLYTASVLELILATGVTSGVGLVLLAPLLWSVLFHHRWESACVAAAVVAAQTVSSIVQATPGAVVTRRVLLWTALSALILVAVHGLRDRIRQSMTANAALQEEVMLTRERDRLASDLRDSVVRTIFDAGMELHGTVAMIGEGPVSTRLMEAVDKLDRATRALRESVFGARHDTSPGRHEPDGP
ncbi:hypothetical protein [Streptomyces sp. NPDC019539]|uniref:hypothetical protein n=1 Tax=Streptomyces sp. NPDC019539 TaxID=3365063 RepID=UPI0037A7CFD6